MNATGVTEGSLEQKNLKVISDTLPEEITGKEQHEQKLLSDQKKLLGIVSVFQKRILQAAGHRNHISASMMSSPAGIVTSAIKKCGKIKKIVLASIISAACIQSFSKLSFETNGL